MNSIFFVMPAYNEAENIECTIRQWYPVVQRCADMGHEVRLVIANDGSKDKTYDIMVNLKEQYPLLDPIDKLNSGHGATVLHLYRYAMERGADYIFQTDSDGQTRPDEFWRLYDGRENQDFQIGYRSHRQDGVSRIIVTRVLRIVVWLMFHVWVKDANTPFRLMRTDKLKAILDVVPNDFFLSNVAIAAIATKWHYHIGWHEITFRPRQGGVNSINLKRIIKIGWKALKDFRELNLRVKQVQSFN